MKATEEEEAEEEAEGAGEGGAEGAKASKLLSLEADAQELMEGAAGALLLAAPSSRPLCHVQSAICTLQSALCTVRLGWLSPGVRCGARARPAGEEVHVDEQGATPLHFAAMAGKEDKVAKLLEDGAQPNVRDTDGLTPMHYAAGDGHVGIVAMLCDGGADPLMPGLISSRFRLLRARAACCARAVRVLCALCCSRAVRAGCWVLGGADMWRVGACRLGGRPPAAHRHPREPGHLQPTSVCCRRCPARGGECGADGSERAWAVGRAQVLPGAEARARQRAGGLGQHAAPSRCRSRLCFFLFFLFLVAFFFLFAFFLFSVLPCLGLR